MIATILALVLVTQDSCEPRIDHYSPYLARRRYEALVRLGQLEGSEFDTQNKQHTNARMSRRMAGIQYRRQMRGGQPRKPTESEINASIQNKLKVMEERDRRTKELDKQLQHPADPVSNNLGDGM